MEQRYKEMFIILFLAETKSVCILGQSGITFLQAIIQ